MPESHGARPALSPLPLPLNSDSEASTDIQGKGRFGPDLRT